jgi:hypothetical protein
VVDLDVTLPDVLVGYVDGDPARPLPEQAPAAFAALDQVLGALTGRHYFAAVLDGVYRACVALQPDDALALPTWTVPGGDDVGRVIENWQLHLPEVRATMAALRQRPDLDPARPCLTHHEDPSALLVLVPVVVSGVVSQSPSEGLC